MEEPNGKKKDREHVSLILHQKIYDLILDVYPVITKTFPKRQRIMLGGRLQESLITLLSIATTINIEKKATISQFRRMDTEIQKVKMFIRLAKDLKFISFKKYEYLQKKVIEVGKITGGYRKFYFNGKD